MGGLLLGSLPLIWGGVLASQRKEGEKAKSEVERCRETHHTVQWIAVAVGIAALTFALGWGSGTNFIRHSSAFYDPENLKYYLQSPLEAIGGKLDQIVQASITIGIVGASIVGAALLLKIAEMIHTRLKRQEEVLPQ